MVPTQEPGELWPEPSPSGLRGPLLATSRCKSIPRAGLVILTPTCFSILQAIFDKFDEDASGTMNSCELRLALTAAGVAGDLG